MSKLWKIVCLKYWNPHFTKAVDERDDVLVLAREEYIENVFVHVRAAEGFPGEEVEDTDCLVAASRHDETTVTGDVAAASLKEYEELRILASLR